MTPSDRIAQLEAELESARRDADNERSTREALDGRIAVLKEALASRVRRLRIRPGEAAVVEVAKVISGDTRARWCDVWQEKFPGTTLIVLDGGAKLSAVLAPPAQEDPS